MGTVLRGGRLPGDAPPAWLSLRLQACVSGNICRIGPYNPTTFTSPRSLAWPLSACSELSRAALGLSGWPGARGAEKEGRGLSAGSASPEHRRPPHAFRSDGSCPLGSPSPHHPALNFRGLCRRAWPVLPESKGLGRALTLGSPGQQGPSDGAAGLGPPSAPFSGEGTVLALAPLMTFSGGS